MSEVGLAAVIVVVVVWTFFLPLDLPPRPKRVDLTERSRVDYMKIARLEEELGIGRGSEWDRDSTRISLAPGPEGGVTWHDDGGDQS